MNFLLPLQTMYWHYWHLLKYALNGFCNLIIVEIGNRTIYYYTFSANEVLQSGTYTEFLKSPVHYVNITSTNQRGYSIFDKPTLSCVMGSFNSILFQPMNYFHTFNLVCLLIFTYCQWDRKYQLQDSI